MSILSDRLGKRLRYLRESAGLSKVGLAKKLDISEGQITKWERGEVRPRPETEDQLAEFFKIDPIELYTPPGTAAFIEDRKPVAEAAKNIGARIKQFRNGRSMGSLCVLAGISNKEWLLYEDGGELPNIDVATRIAGALGYSVIEVLAEDARHLMSGGQDEYVMVPHYDVEVSAGDGSLNDQEFPPSRLAFKKDFIKLRGLDMGKLFVVTVKGNSMEPQLSEDDIVLVDGSRVKVAEDALFVIRLGSYLYVKRMQRLPGGRIKVTSNNPEYEPFEIDLANPPDDVQVLGKVVWIGREV